MFRQLPIILAILIAAIISFGSFIPKNVAINLFALSLTITWLPFFSWIIFYIFHFLTVFEIGF